MVQIEGRGLRLGHLAVLIHVQSLCEHQVTIAVQVHSLEVQRARERRGEAAVARSGGRGSPHSRRGGQHAQGAAKCHRGPRRAKVGVGI